jgi:hypothetical protein
VTTHLTKQRRDFGKIGSSPDDIDDFQLIAHRYLKNIIRQSYCRLATGQETLCS